MEFLQDIADRGYPTDYLLARVRGRRVFFLKDWEEVMFSPDISERLMSSHYRTLLSEYSSEGIRIRYLNELQWIYYQMNKKSREIFHPYFMYSELDTLLICLRYQIEKGRKNEIERILAFSLLSKKIRDILSMEADLPIILEVLEKRSLFFSGRSPALHDIFVTDGLSGVEHTITGTLFEHIMNMQMHPLIERFFVSVIDSRNIINLYKYLKWGIAGGPAIIAGGSIRESVFSKILQSREVSEVIDLIYKHAGSYAEEPSASNIESILRKWLTRQIKKMERESQDIGLILHYLWRFSVEARNLSILTYAYKVDKSIIKGELVH